MHSTTLLRPLFTNFSLSSLVGSKVRVLAQDLYGHDSVCVMPNPLARTWDSNSGSYLCMPLVLPTQSYKILYIQRHRDRRRLRREVGVTVFVRQSNIQLTCYSYRRYCLKTRLSCSLLNCNYTLQVRCNQRL